MQLRSSCRTPQGVVIAPFPVVDEDEREHGVGAVFAARGGRFLEHLNAALAAAAEPGDVGHQAQRRRQRRDDVAVGADGQPGVLSEGSRRSTFSCSS